MVEVLGHIATDKYKTELTNGRTNITGDEPISNGGTDLGFSPSELLSAALATCTCVTLRMYADKKQWELTDVNTTVYFERDKEKNITNIKREIKLSGNLTEEQKQKLLMIANHCFIHKTLTNPIQINSSLI